MLSGKARGLWGWGRWGMGVGFWDEWFLGGHQRDLRCTTHTQQKRMDSKMWKTSLHCNKHFAGYKRLGREPCLYGTRTQAYPTLRCLVDSIYQLFSANLPLPHLVQAFQHSLEASWPHIRGVDLDLALFQELLS